MKRFGILLAASLIIGLIGPGSLAGREEKGRGGSGWKHKWAEIYYKWTVKRAHLKPDDLKNYSIGQSHIDAAWLWRVDQTRDKCLKTFGSAVRHMEMYPDFHYSQSAPQYYEWVMEDDPALFEKILDFEKKGQWEIVGGQWVEPDNNMPDGESFVRQRLLGMRFYKEHFGHMPDISWLLDSFGYQWNLPQILAKSGARYFWTNKLTWNDTTVYPFHLFWWQAPDGSRVLAYFCKHAGGGPYPGSEINKFHHTRLLLPAGAGEFVADYSTDPEIIKNRMTGEWLNVVGVFYGKGDGGHGPTLAEIQRQDYLVRKGYTKFSTARELYAAIESYSDRAPVWNDELYLEYHRGVLTTQAWLKRANRRAEQMMRTAEVLQCVGSRLGLDYAYAGLKKIWKLALLNQFHDILPGSSIPEVYEDSREDYKKILDVAGAAAADGIAALAAKVDTSAGDPSLKPVVVFNTLSWERSGLVELKAADANQGVTDSRGRRIASQHGKCADLSGECLIFRAEDVPSMGYKVYGLKAGEVGAGGDGPAALDEAGSITLENGMVSVKVDKRTGWLTSLKCLRSGAEFLDGDGNRLMAWHDRTLNYPAWNIQTDYLDHPKDMPDASGVSVTAEGPLFVEVTARRRFNRSDIAQITRIYRGDPRIHLTTEFDFHEADTLVKAEFDTPIKTDKITAEISYAAIDRPTHPRTPAEKAMWEASCQRWLDLSDGEKGLALLNNGKYGYSVTDDGTGFRLTLIKGALYPISASEAINVDDAGMSQAKKLARSRNRMTDQGRHVAWTALLPHKGDWKEARLWRAGYEFNTPLAVKITDRHKGPLPAAGSFVSLDNPDVYVGALKRAEDGDDLVLRLVEAAGAKSGVKVSLNNMGKISRAAETDLLEWNPRALKTDKGSIELNMNPYEIKTVKLTLEK
jgi:alpha-mannosidase